MDKRIEDIALFDMDGTLCDYEKALHEGLELLRSPNEQPYLEPVRDSSPQHIHNRADLIRSSVDWWANLPKFPLGWDVLQVAKHLEYNIMILTQGPRKNSNAWSGKVTWINKNLPGTDITVTRNKGLVYGKVLVDDFPGYIDKWLQWRPRGQVIMPASTENRNYTHPQVIRYDGTNIQEVEEAMAKAKLRDN